MLKRYIGSKEFYKMVMAVAVPIMIQNFITNFVGMLDNIMVGQVGTAQMSGVSIVNNILFIFYLCIFGATSGAGIFTVQFFGAGNSDGVRHTVRYKNYISLGIVVIGTVLLALFGSVFIGLFLTGEDAAGEAHLYLSYGESYLSVMLWGMLPFALSNVYSSTMRECGETVVPMAAGIAAVAVNLFFNWVLIFGNLGAPEMGIVGAAVATVISRFVELAICVVYCHTHAKRFHFVQGLYTSFAIPKELFGKITFKSLPLLANEALWSVGITTLSLCYSFKGLNVVPAINISNTITNTMMVSLLAMGNAVGIIIGQRLGAGRPADEVVDYVRKLMAFTVSFTLIFSVLQVVISGFFPELYNTTEDVKHLASMFIIVAAVSLPARAFTNASYFTLRAGGKTLVTFLFDSCFVWVVLVPLAFCLCSFTALNIVIIYAVVEGMEFIKCLLGYYMLRGRKWINRIVV